MEKAMITEFPLLVFTVLTGIAAGGYVGSALFPRKSKDDRAWLFPLISFILIVIGGLSAMAHLGRPMMVLNVLNNPTSSLTMEGASAGVLALIALVDFIIAMRTGTANRVVRIIGAIVGVACMCIVTMAYTTSYGNVVWISMPTWPLFVLGDLAVGSAFWLMFADEPNKALAAFIAVVGALFAIVLIWQATTFASFGAAGMGFVIAGAVFAVAGAVGAYITSSMKLWRTAATVVFILFAIAVVLSRYGFYMASII